MPILMEMLNDDIKTFAEYSEYLEKSKGGKPKGRGKGLVTKKGVELVAEKIETVYVSKKKRSEMVIKQNGQSEDLEDDVDSKEIKEEEEPQLTKRRQTSVAIGSGSFFSSSSEYEVKDISSDDDSDAADDKEKADDSNTSSDEKTAEEQADEEQAGDEQHVKAMFMFNTLEEIDKSVKAHLKKNLLPKDIPDFCKIKQEKASKQSTPKYSEKKKRKKNDSESSKKDKDQAGSSKKGKSPSKSSKTDKSIHADETIHDVEMDAEESVEEDLVDAEDPSQAYASVPKRDSKNLEYLTIRNVKNKDATSLTKPKAARTVIQKRVKDVQLGVERYQTNLNVTMPQVRCVGLDDKELYTIFYEPKGVVYPNKDNNKFLMKADKLYKFVDGTLKKEKKQKTSMLEKIKKTLLTRRIMRNLKYFVGGRKIEMDYRLLVRTE
nr:hypothetical protein [Tanacetum cinerariifolium]